MSWFLVFGFGSEFCVGLRFTAYVDIEVEDLEFMGRLRLSTKGVLFIYRPLCFELVRFKLLRIPVFLWFLELTSHVVLKLCGATMCRWSFNPHIRVIRDHPIHPCQLGRPELTAEEAKIILEQDLRLAALLRQAGSGKSTQAMPDRSRKDSLTTWENLGVTGLVPLELQGEASSPLVEPEEDLSDATLARLLYC